MEQKEKLTAWQHVRRAVVCYLLFNAITASAIQYFVEMSPLLKIYNWLLGIGAVMLVFEVGLDKTSEKQNTKISKPLRIFGWIIGMMGTIICIVYDEYVYDVISTFGSR